MEDIMNVVDGLSKEQLDAAYWKRERMFHIEDAMQQTQEYMYLNNCVVDFDHGDFEVLAERFEENHDCNVADNVLWQNIIEEYVEEMYQPK